MAEVNAGLETVLGVCDGARKFPVANEYERGYNDALGNIYDYILKYESESLFKSTVKDGLWNRNYEEEF